jgi:uncharacterized membrane protein YgdD (TMEM256/DUF423 family)
VKKIPSLILVIAALEGAAGVALAAAAAHSPGGGSLVAASQLLMIHAAAGVGLSALLRRPAPRGSILAAIALALQFGVALFALDIASRHFVGDKLFAYAAPIGGGLTIISWLALAVWALAELAATPQARD